MVVDRTKYSEGKLGIFEKKEKRCVGKKKFMTPASVGTVYSRRLFGDYNSRTGATSVDKTS